MFDEMKLKNDIYWNCSNNQMVGLAATDNSNKLILHDEISALLSDDLDNDETTSEEKVACSGEKEKSEDWSFKPASYVNLWRLRTTKNVTHSTEFFFNGGSLTGDELLRQFMHVTAHYELIGFRLIGLLCDMPLGRMSRIYRPLVGALYSTC
jgi:hypothetical protein